MSYRHCQFRELKHLARGSKIVKKKYLYFFSFLWPILRMLFDIHKSNFLKPVVISPLWSVQPFIQVTGGDSFILSFIHEREIAMEGHLLSSRIPSCLSFIQFFSLHFLSFFCPFNIFISPYPFIPLSLSLLSHLLPLPSNLSLHSFS